MTLKLRLPTSRFRRRGGGDRGRHDQLPNASDESKTSTKTSSLSSGASSSCSSTTYQPGPPLPVIIASNVTPSTSNATHTPPTSTTYPSVASFPPQQPPAALTDTYPSSARHGGSSSSRRRRHRSWRQPAIPPGESRRTASFAGSALRPRHHWMCSSHRRLGVGDCRSQTSCGGPQSFSVGSSPRGLHVWILVRRTM